MGKEKFWFKHDYGARNDPKLQMVLMKLGQAGKGVYWDLIELLYERDGSISLSECQGIAFLLHTEHSLLLSLINDFGLFQNDGKVFWSERVVIKLQEFAHKSEMAKNSAEARWKHKNEGVEGRKSVVKKVRTQSERNANALQSQSERNALAMQDIDIDIDKEIDTDKNTGGEGVSGKSKSSKKTPVPVVTVELPWGAEFAALWEQWKAYKKTEHRFSYKSAQSQQAAINSLVELAGGKEETAHAIIMQSLEKGWKGFFQLSNTNKSLLNGRANQSLSEIISNIPAGAFDILKGKK